MLIIPEIDEMFCNKPAKRKTQETQSNLENEAVGQNRNAISDAAALQPREIAGEMGSAYLNKMGRGNKHTRDIVSEVNLLCGRK